MSRLGRDYLQVGMYTEIKFPNADIRFIAINNGVDSENQSDNDFIPFLNIINEWYAKDTSKKIRAVIKAKGESGKHLTTNPPYGYIKDPNENNKWIVDPEAADNVRLIFKLCMEGYGPTQIASYLEKEKILIPVYYLQSKGINTPTRSLRQEPYHWESSTIARILERMEYLGHTVNFRTYTKSYKQKKQMYHDKADWQIFENTHKAIIDEETFKIVQKIRKGRRRRTDMDDMPMLSGMLYCADCGQKLYEDNVEGKISDERFVKMSASYEDEQKSLKERISELECEMATDKEKSLNVNYFLDLVKRYTEVPELTAEIIREFIEKVYVYHPEKINGQKIQRVRIVWNCIGELPTPKESA